MANEAEKLLHFLQLLLPVFVSDRSVSTKLTENIRVGNALVDDLGHNMHNELRVRWRDRITEAVSDCDRNIYGLPEGIHHLYAGALMELYGRFYKVVEEDYLAAGKYYEEAAKTIKLINKDFLLSEIKSLVVQEVMSEEDAEKFLPALLQFLEPLGVNLFAVSLWDRAADCYFGPAKETVDDAQRCYELGIETIKELYPELEEKAKLGELDKHLCHLSLSLANVLSFHCGEWEKGEWEKTEALCREAADAIFFNKLEKSNDQYSDLCSIINSFGATSFGFSLRKECLPHVATVFNVSRYKENFLKLAVELGQKALDKLIMEYVRKEGFPVPETFYLVGILSYFYRDLKQYEKCTNLVPLKTDFGSDYWEWVWDQLEFEVCDTAFEWVHPHVVHCRELFFAEGLLQRPDYKDFMENIKKIEESHQRLELRFIRQENMLREKEKPQSIQEIRAKLLSEHPWLDSIANPGSLINAEDLYQRIGKQNWAEVVMGYCNAVEEELKQYIYKEYLAFRASFDKHYAEESERQRNRGSVLYFMASIKDGGAKCKVWEQLVTAKMPKHREFVLQELPGLLSQLVLIRNKAAHGEKLEKKWADQARQIVLGRPGKVGLLERLSKIRSEQGPDI